MEFATEDHSSHLGSCAGDYLCSYMSTFAWRTPTQPLPMELNPRVVFERMFGSDAATKEERKLQLDQNTSILDGVTESIKSLSKGLGQKDVAKLNEYREWGVQHIWLVEPGLEKLHVYEASGLREVQALEIPEFGLSVKLADLLP